MPLPLLVWGAVGLVGALGIGAHESAKETNEKAERRAEDEFVDAWDNGVVDRF